MVVKKGVPELYNLKEDIHEDHNLASAHPEVVKQMVEIILREHTPSTHFQVTLPRP